MLLPCNTKSNTATVYVVLFRFFFHQNHLLPTVQYHLACYTIFLSPGASKNKLFHLGGYPFKRYFLLQLPLPFLPHTCEVLQHVQSINKPTFRYIIDARPTYIQRLEQWKHQCRSDSYQHLETVTLNQHSQKTVPWEMCCQRRPTDQFIKI